MEPDHKENRQKKIEKKHSKRTVHSEKKTVNKLNLSTLKCIYTNADSLSNKMTELKTLVKYEKPHIIAVTEVKPKNFKEILKADFILKDYEIHESNVLNRVGRGIIIYVHNSLQVNDVDILSDYEESLWIDMKLTKGDRLLLGCVYRSDSGLQSHNDMLLDAISKAASLPYSHLLIVGDFNYNYISWDYWTTQKSTNSNEYKFIERLRDLYLYQRVNKPTRYRAENRPSIIDLVITNEEQMVNDIKYCSPLGRSDHSVLIFDFSCYVEVENKTHLKYYYQKGDYQEMSKDLDLDWETLLPKENVNDQWTLFKDKLLIAQDKYIDHKLVSNHPTWKDKGKFPLDNEIWKEIHKKHRAWERAYTDKTESAKKAYNRQRNKVRKLTRRQQREHEKGIAKEAKSNPKPFWKYANSKTKSHTSVSPLVKSSVNGEEILTTTDKEKADILVDYFSSVLTQELDSIIPTLDSQTVNNPLSTIHVTSKQVLDKLLQLDCNKSAGPDLIHPRVLKELAPVIASPIAKIFNTSIQTHELPMDWRVAHITPVFKKGKRKLSCNYRPISLTSILCKILESIIREHIITHFKDNDLFSNKQFGFLSGRSTSLQLLNVIEIWMKILDEGGNIDCYIHGFRESV